MSTLHIQLPFYTQKLVGVVGFADNYNNVMIICLSCHTNDCKFTHCMNYLNNMSNRFYGISTVSVPSHSSVDLLAIYTVKYFPCKQN